MLRQITEGVSQDDAPEGILINMKKNGIISTFLGLLSMMVKGTNMGPTVVSFDLVGGDTVVGLFRVRNLTHCFRDL